MKKIKYASTGMLVSPICFGAWQIGGYPFYNNKIDDQSAITLVKRVIETGINFIDTAPVYGFGRSESIIGQAIKGIRDQVIISTKCDLRWKNENLNSIYTDASQKAILEEVDLSLKRLNTDYIDLYMLHKPDKDTKTPIGESIETLDFLKKNGKIRHYGVSSFNRDQLEEARRYGDIESLQNQYSLLFHDFDKTHANYLIENNIGFQAYAPLHRGVLTDLSIENLKEKNETAINWMLDQTNPKKLEIVASLKGISKKYDVPFASFVIACTLARPAITTTIIGSTNISHIETALRSLDLQLSTEDLDAVEDLITV